LHVVAAYPAKGEFEVTAEMAAVEGGLMRLWYHPLEDGTKIWTFITPSPFHGNVPVGKVVTLDVVVRETGETPYYQFPGVARTCAQAVNRTVSAVAAAVATG
jgi:outer membrane protein assembly factor BamB